MDKILICDNHNATTKENHYARYFVTIENHNTRKQKKFLLCYRCYEILLKKIDKRKKSKIVNVLDCSCVQVAPLINKRLSKL